MGHARTAGAVCSESASGDTDSIFGKLVFDKRSGLILDRHAFFKKYKEKLTGRILPWVTVILAWIIAVFFRNGMFGFSYLPAFLCAVASYVAVYGFSSLFKPLYPVIHYISGLSYEIYLIHHRIYYLLIPVFLNRESSVLTIVFMFITTSAIILALSEILSVVSSWINKKVFSRAS